jgi:hypothetical protein
MMEKDDQKCNEEESSPFSWRKVMKEQEDSFVINEEEEHEDAVGSFNERSH